MQTIGKRLAEIRKSKNFKQTELAEMLNVSQQVISNIERGVTAPDIEQLKKFADIYNISLDQLVGREFFGEDADDVERRIISYIKQMDDEGKELRLVIVAPELAELVRIHAFYSLTREVFSAFPLGNVVQDLKDLVTQ